MNDRKTHRVIRLFCAITITAALTLLYRHTPPQTPQSAEIRLTTAEAREGWLNLCGWAVTPVSESPMRIPTVWNTEIGQRWLMLQGKQGLSPEDHAGEAATRYCYHIENIAAEGMTADAWYAELVLCGDLLVGAQVYCAASPDSIQSVR